MAKTRLKTTKKPVVQHGVLKDGVMSFKDEQEEIKKIVPRVDTKKGTFYLGGDRGKMNNGGAIPSTKAIDAYGDAIKECNLNSMTLSKTAKAVGISVNQVHTISKHLGLRWDGTMPEHNAMVLKKKNEERKQVIKAGLLEATEKFVRRLLEPTYTYVVSGATRIMVEEVPVIPGGEARDISTAARNLMFVVERLEAYEREKERNETSTIDDWLRAMTGENEWNAYNHDVNYKKITEEEDD